MLSRLAGRLVLGLALALAAAMPQVRADDEIRALWVTRWSFRSPEDVRAIVRNAKWAGFNRLYFQVRGDGTVFYPSSVEPWTWELSGQGIEGVGTHPGWDPLAYAIATAQAADIELHAWLNVLPAWKKIDPPPADSGQLFVAHPDWLMVDSRKRRMSPATHSNFYAFLNPALPEVRAYLVRLFHDLARRYPQLDGVHMDYIRYPGEVGDFSYDAYSLNAFSRYSGGKRPDQAPEAWNRWRAEQIDRLVADISRAVRQVRPRIEISAAVVADYPTATGTKMQRSLDWPDEGWVDTLVPMAYHYSMRKYTEYLETFLRGRRPQRGEVIIGLWPADKWRKEGYDLKMLERQVRLARDYGADGISIFSYPVLFPNHKPDERARLLREKCFGQGD